MDMNLNTEHSKRKVRKLFLLIFLSLCAIIFLIASLFYRQEVDLHFRLIATGEQEAVTRQHIAIADEFDFVLGDLLFLSHQNELLQFLEDGSAETLRGMQSEYQSFATTKHMYDQIRFLDRSGMEIVRINDNSRNPVVVADSALQNKASRYYFKESVALDAHEIYISPMDLNVEHGQVERPFKPMLRFGTPVFDRQGTKRGVILLNYLASNLLNRILHTGGEAVERKMLLNAQGYWLLTPVKEDEWGFMFEGGKQRTFSNAFPAEWDVIRNDKQGQFRSENGLFTFQTITPINESTRYVSTLDSPDGVASIGNCSKGLFWVLVSKVSSAELDEYPNNLLKKMLLINAFMITILGIGAWQIALALTRRNLYQSHLLALAMYDSLTGLPNRKLFMDQLTNGLELAARYQRSLGLLYLDLDGFKQVNDTLGHEAGDELLVQVGIRLKDCVRKSDTVARLGGDEFAVVLPESDDTQGAILAGRKIVEAISQPFTLKSGPATIGVSIGVALYPHHATTAEELIKEADQAMYRAKARGKNTCVLAKD